MAHTQPTAAVDICNLALEYFAEHVITTIDVPTNEAEQRMQRWYDHVRRIVLREQLWNFANKFAELPRAGDGPANYADAYNLPNDWVRLNSIGVDRRHPKRNYDMGEGQIFINNAGAVLPIWYNANITDVSKMDALFIDILAIRLAMKTGFSFTKKKSTVEGLAALLKMEEPKATSVDGQERIPIRIQRSRYLTARKYGSYSQRNYQYYDTDC